MVEKLKKHLLPLLVIVVLSLLPFYWLRGGEVILGHDAGTPLSPTEHFEDRLQLWTYRYGGGSDQTFAIAGFFIHGFEYVIDQIPVSVSMQQRIEFSLYFFMIALSMYIAASTIFPRIEPQFALIAAIIYQFNHFILQAWFIAERTKFSVYIALPLLAAIAFKLMRRELQPVYAGLLSALILTVFNGGGFLPLYASLFLVIGSICLLVLSLKRPFRSYFPLIIIYALTFILGYFLLNLYWMLPYFFYVRTSFSQLVAEAGGFNGILNWVTSISQNTSFINLLRLQGIQEWYVNPEHPYAQPYFTNPLLILLSFVPLGILVATFWKLREAKNFTIAILFAILLLALFLMAGSHKPFGFVYIFLLKYVSGFVAFRTPYYKFAPAFFFAFSLIASYFIGSVLQNKSKKFIYTAVFIGVYLLYHFPFFSVNFFQYTKERSTKVTVPSYVQEYADYIDENPDKLVRTALLPGLNLNDLSSQYKWGYWSLAPLHSLLDTHQYLLPAKSSSVETEITEEFYKALLQNNEYWLAMSKSMGIDSILVEKDFTSFKYGGKSIEEVYQQLDANPKLSLLREFGEWKLYKISSDKPVTANYVHVITTGHKLGEVNYINDFLYRKLGYKAPLAVSTEKINEVNSIGTLVKASCQDCQISREQTFLAEPNLVFIPGSKIGFLGRFFNSNYEQNLVPSRSLQRLYIVQSLIMRKEQADLRIPIWHQYLQDMEKYQQEIDRDVANIITNRATILQKFSNIQFQKNILKEIAGFIDTGSEAQLFIEATKQMEELERKVLATDTITITPNKYKLSTAIPENGNYSIFLYNNLLNAGMSQEKIKFKINEFAIDAPIATSSGWTEIGNIDLENKEYQLELTDVKFANPLQFPEKITVGNNKPCTNIYDGQLATGHYSIALQLSSPQTSANVTVHVVKESEKKPLLPYWGSVVELPQNLEKTSTIPFVIEESQQTAILLCSFTLKREASINLLKFDLNRQTIPVVFFYKNNNPWVDEVGIYTLERNKNTYNSYTVTTSVPALLNTFHPYNQNWKLDSDKFSTVEINEGSEAILVPPGSHVITETYDLQRYYKYGALLSIGSGLLGCAALFLLRRRQKNK